MDSECIEFTFKSAWESVKEIYPAFVYDNEVWFPGHSPEFACCLLKAIYDRLPTRSRLLAHEIIQSDTRVLCHSSAESKSHLLFQCAFTKYVALPANEESSPWMAQLQPFHNVGIIYAPTLALFDSAMQNCRNDIP